MNLFDISSFQSFDRYLLKHGYTLEASSNVNQKSAKIISYGAVS